MKFNWRNWPWSQQFTGDYSDDVVRAIQAMAAGDVADMPSGAASSICRAAAQLTARVFGSVEVSNAGPAMIDPHFLMRAGLAAVYAGELYADVRIGSAAVTFDVALGVDEQLGEDRYRLELPPLRDNDSERLRIVDDPLKVIFNPSPALRGMPLWGAANAALAAVELSVGNEAAVIPNVRIFSRAVNAASLGGMAETEQAYDKQMQRLAKGGVQWVEGQNFGPSAHLMDADRALVTPQSSESMGRRLGPEFGNATPQILVELAARAGVEVGWPPSMVYAQAAGAGQAIAAGYRHWIGTTVAPQLTLLERELRRVLGMDGLTLTLPRELRQVDIQTKARAAASLLSQGVSEETAFATAGLEVE